MNGDSILGRGETGTLDPDLVWIRLSAETSTLLKRFSLAGR